MRSTNARQDLFALVKRVLKIVALGVAATFSGAAAAQSLPRPDGPYAVGVRAIEFHVEQRRLPAIAWYPAHASRDATRPYLARKDAQLQGAALARNMRYDPASIAALTTAHAHSTIDARPLRRRRGFPILIYSHGFTLWPAQNTALLERLASQGYIVVSIAHPGDSIDIRLKDGTVVPTFLGADPDTGFPALFKAFITGQDHAIRTSTLPGYAAAFAKTRLGRSMVAWQDDTLAIHRAIAGGTAPAQEIWTRGDPGRIGLIGMSFGGLTAASTCRLIPTCRAAVNLDGQNFDPAMFDRPVERPLLLMLSDWTSYPVFEGQSADPAFSPNDYAYEPWKTSGLDPDVVRVRVGGITHMGFTDLVGLMTGPNRNERVGAIAGPRAFAAIGDTVLAFLDTHLAGGDRAAVDRAIAAHPELHRHNPGQLRLWAKQRSH